MHRADERHPGWNFATHVGYSTPEHRAAIAREGVSPLHRLSFQSSAYQQLALYARSRDVLELLERRPACLAASTDDRDGVDPQRRRAWLAQGGRRATPRRAPACAGA